MRRRNFARRKCSCAASSAGFSAWRSRAGSLAAPVPASATGSERRDGGRPRRSDAHRRAILFVVAQTMPALVWRFPPAATSRPVHVHANRSFEPPVFRVQKGPEPAWLKLVASNCRRCTTSRKPSVDRGWRVSCTNHAPPGKTRIIGTRTRPVPVFFCGRTTRFFSLTNAV
jgi:hypothetical protein